MTTGDAIRVPEPGPGGRVRGGHRRPPADAGGVQGNERLTALTGTVLLVIVATIVFTFWFSRPLPRRRTR